MPSSHNKVWTCQMPYLGYATNVKIDAKASTASGITAAVDISYVFVPPLPLKSESPAARLAVQKLRKLVDAAEELYSAKCGMIIPCIEKLDAHSDTFDEYFRYCHAATQSYAHASPLPPKSGSAVTRAAVQRMRKLVEKAANGYSRACEVQIPVIKGLGAIGGAIGEYLEYCLAALLDRKIRDIKRFLPTKPVPQKDATAMDAAGKLKHALLLRSQGGATRACAKKCPGSVYSICSSS
ncbi:hypothetical protein H9P43_006695 [Blastocladiella emersonii ATCC 22665]|nr:hypothetical protein H9P43_006695 [Blastocladiella emersonii ATCC 22665]